MHLIDAERSLHASSSSPYPNAPPAGGAPSQSEALSNVLHGVLSIVGGGNIDASPGGMEPLTSEVQQELPAATAAADALPAAPPSSQVPPFVPTVGADVPLK